MTAPLGGIYWRARIITPEGQSVSASTYGWAASASGTRTHQGSASGAYGWAGFAGQIVKRGNASGGYGWSSTATGETPIPAVPEFDAASGATTIDTTTWSHTAEAGSYVLVYVSVRPLGGGTGTTGVTYGGAPMELLCRWGETTCFGLADVAGGTQTVAVSVHWSSNIVSASAVSYTGATSATNIQTQQGGNTITKTATCAPGELIVQGFGVVSTDIYFPFVQDWVVSGGTSRSIIRNSSSSIGVNDSPETPTTFNGATAATAAASRGVTVRLSSRPAELDLHMVGAQSGTPTFGAWTTTLTSVAGGYVLFPVFVRGSADAGPVTIDGQAMTLLASQKCNNQNATGTLLVYGYADTVGGFRTIHVSTQIAIYAIGQPLVYRATSASASTVYGTGSTAAATSMATNVGAALPATLPHALGGAGGVERTVVAIFGTETATQDTATFFTTPTGTNRINFGNYYGALCVSDAVRTTANRTFQAGLPTANEWAGITVELT